MSTSVCTFHAKLEMIYLMRVSLELRSISDSQNFISVSHVCYNAFSALRINPNYYSQKAYLWYVKHFMPDTIDFKELNIIDLTPYSNVSCYQNISFGPLIKNKMMTKTYTDLILPKVTRLSLVKLDKQFITKFARKFTQLELLKGGLDEVVQFFNSFVKNENDKFLKFPKKILVFDTFDEKSIPLIEKLGQLLPTDGRSRLYFIASKSVTSETVLDEMRIGEYFYNIFMSNAVQQYRDKVCLNDGCLECIGNFNFSELTTLIHKTVARKFFIRNPAESIGGTFNEFIKEIAIVYGKGSEDFDVNFENPVFYEGRQNFWFDSDVLEEIKFMSCNNIFFKSKSKFLKTIKLEHCHEMSIFYDFHNGEIFKKCGVIYMEHSLNIKFSDISKLTTSTFEQDKSNETTTYSEERKIQTNKSTILPKLIVISGCVVDVLIFDEINKIIVIDTTCITLKNISLKTTSVVFDKVHQLICKNNTLELLCVDFNKEIENYFESPFLFKKSTKSKFEKDKIWVCHKFFSMNNHLVITKDDCVVKNTMYTTVTNDMLFSYNFYNKNNADLPMCFYNKKNKIDHIHGIRYFEVEVTGQSFIAIGLYSAKLYQSGDANVMIGCDVDTVGFYSDDGNIYCGGNIEIQTSFHYGNCVGKVDVVGCGYIIEEKSAFFIMNGKMAGKIAVEWDSVCAAITCNEINTLKINRGQKMFVTNLSLFKERKKEDCVVI
ncbi:hypothetical protein EIN_269980 [Entamoeba invadens IP1]|uniref:B30.2/SPRY domain-containing protein n=1 Tax=Entamoeba invadens IP1 TaxID=370355 RepID=A0A0A1UBS0_ENTIV|nr:hypothetical protein EIN_269980 [Entamoeba invadens IP1]ELP91132.1 hypothetical protein EIN_269980 [Entamoeba invadens IP1]|eukprot:XP_004257903.1 hypothetical protein EIN_269980 [Entamoeba invadens IP1]